MFWMFSWNSIFAELHWGPFWKFNGEAVMESGNFCVKDDASVCPAGDGMFS